MQTIKLMTRSALCVSALLAASIPPAGAQNSSPAIGIHVAERLQPFPGLDLGVKDARGVDAINLLGMHLADVASWYGKSPDQFRNEILKDRKIRIDRNGRLFAVEELDQPVTPQSTAGTRQSGIQDGALVALDQTFYLHSHSGANRTVYLDFVGATVTGTAWNASQNNRTIIAQPYDLDGNPAAFSSSELQRIQYIWQRVAEDYAPFDVDVTTQAPSPDLLTRSDVNDQVFGTTVVITRKDGVYNCNCGGIAYVGVFDAVPGSHPADYYKPAFVFYDMLGSGDEKAVAEAISHEAGHNMGLHHDGTSSVDYYAGQGNDGTTGWAPIMGVGYYRPLVQFSKGEYSGANNKEDDFIVAQNFGLPLRLDDYGSSVATATPFVQSESGGTLSGSMDGVIETASDRDVFSIAAGPGLLQATAVPANRSPDMDIVLSLLDSSGHVLATDNQINVLRATLSYTIASQGMYYLEVRGTGQDDPATTGYSNYGSVGNFRLAASYPAPVGTPPVAVISASTTSGTAPMAVTLDGTASHDDGRVTQWYWDFGDGNNDASGTLSSATHVYQVAGVYLVRLTVVDDTGLSSGSTQIINVAPPAPQSSAQSIEIALKSNRKHYYWAVATITVVNQNGQPLSKASIQADWNGIVSRSVTATTNQYGKATLTSPRTKAAGCFNVTINGITSVGFPFNGATTRTAQVCH